MSTYTYSLSQDFGNILKISQLHNIIDTTGSIITQLIGISLTGDIVEISFMSTLSGSEKVILDQIIAAYTLSEESVIQIQNTGTDNTTYTLAVAPTANRVLILPDVSDTVITANSSQILTNKTLSDSSTFLADNTDSTKRVQFECSAISTATTRTLTIPNANTTIVGTDTVQTLTNKTLTAPLISTINNTGVLTLPTTTDTLVGRSTTDTLTNKTLTAPLISTINNTGVLTLPTTTDTLVGRSTTDTLANKTLVDSSTFLADNTDSTKRVQFECSAISTATTRTLTIPNANTTIVGTDTVQTLTNKTLTAPLISTINNTGVLTLPTTTDTLVGRSTTDTLTNKTIDSSTNVITCNKLRTTTGAVTIDTASAPTSGQVLTATSATTANWQTGAGGGALPYYNYAESLPVSSKTGADNVDIGGGPGYDLKVTLTTATIPSGTYRIGWSYNWAHRSTSTDFLAKVFFNDSLIAFHQEEPQDSGSDQLYLNSGFANVTLTTSRVSTLRLYYNSNNPSVTSYISNARLEIFKV